MKNIKQYLLEELFVTPMNTIGAGDIIAPTPETLGSGDIPQPMCIDIKTGKLYKRRKKFRRYKIV
jgi:hypothetical protein